VRALIDASRRLSDAEIEATLAVEEMRRVEAEYAATREAYEAANSKWRVARARVLRTEGQLIEARMMLNEVQHQRGDEQ
jgi:hypothetical protein